MHNILKIHFIQDHRIYISNAYYWLFVTDNLTRYNGTEEGIICHNIRQTYVPHILIHQTFKSLKFMARLDFAPQQKSGRKNSSLCEFKNVGRSIVLKLF